MDCCILDVVDQILCVGLDQFSGQLASWPLPFVIIILLLLSLLLLRFSLHFFSIYFVHSQARAQTQKHTHRQTDNILLSSQFCLSSTDLLVFNCFQYSVDDEEDSISDTGESKINIIGIEKKKHAEIKKEDEYWKLTYIYKWFFIVVSLNWFFFILYLFIFFSYEPNELCGCLV